MYAICIFHNIGPHEAVPEVSKGKVHITQDKHVPIVWVFALPLFRARTFFLSDGANTVASPWFVAARNCMRQRLLKWLSLTCRSPQRHTTVKTSYNRRRRTTGRRVKGDNWLSWVFHLCCSILVFVFVLCQNSRQKNRKTTTTNNNNNNQQQLQYYSVLQSTTPVLLCTTPVLLRTTKYYSSTTLYYKELLQYYSVLQSTTLYYKYYSVLQSTTPVLLCTRKYYSSTTLYYKVLLRYYSVLLHYYSVLHSTTPVLLCPTKYYSCTTLYYKVLLCTTKYYSSTTKYYSSTTLYYKELLQYYSVLQSTTPVLFSWLIRVTYETLYTMRGTTEVLLQNHRLLRLPRKMTLMIDPHHIWNVSYNARSNRDVSPTSPNTAPATKSNTHHWPSSHLKRYLHCAEQHVSWPKLTKYSACHAK